MLFQKYRLNINLVFLVWSMEHHALDPSPPPTPPKFWVRPCLVHYITRVILNAFVIVTK